MIKASRHIRRISLRAARGFRLKYGFSGVLAALLAVSVVVACVVILWLWPTSTQPVFSARAWKALCNEHHNWFDKFIDQFSDRRRDQYRRDDQLRKIVDLLDAARNRHLTLDPREIAGVQDHEITYEQLGRLSRSLPPGTIQRVRDDHAVEQTHGALKVVGDIRKVLTGLGAARWPKLVRIEVLADEYADDLAASVTSQNLVEIVEGIEKLIEYDSDLEETYGLWDQVRSERAQLEKIAADLGKIAGTDTENRVNKQLEVFREQADTHDHVPWTGQTKPKIEQNLAALQEKIRKMQAGFENERMRWAPSFEELVDQLRQRTAVVDSGSQVLYDIWQQECGRLLVQARKENWPKSQLLEQANDLVMLLQSIDERFVLELGVGMRARNWNNRLAQHWRASVREETLRLAVDQIDWVLLLKSPAKSFSEPQLKVAATAYQNRHATALRMLRDLNRLEDLLDGGYGLRQHPGDQAAASIEHIYNQWHAHELLDDQTTAQFVMALLERVAKLKTIEGQTSRSEIVKIAQSEYDPALAMAAWRRFDELEWPAVHQALEDEQRIQKNLKVNVLDRVSDDTRRRTLQDELAEGARRRWIVHFGRLSQRKDIDQAIALMGVFGVGPQMFQDQPRLRFNMLPHTLRGMDWALPEEQLREQLSQMYTMAQDLAGELGAWPAVQAFIDDLREIVDQSEHEYSVDPSTSGPAQIEGWSGQTRDSFGKQVVYSWQSPISGERHALTFVRVDLPYQQGKPCYLSTTEVPVGLFIDVVDAVGWRDVMTPLLPGADQIQGPCAWSWVDHQDTGQGLRIAKTWYENQPPTNLDAQRPYYAQPLAVQAVDSEDDLMRLGREKDRPSRNHPIHHISATAAFYFAALMRCRLPTAVEWEAAVAVNKQGPPNLRDQTWKRQQEHIKHIMNAGGVNFQWPDSGIFIPDSEAGDLVPDQADATATLGTDGLLWFATIQEHDATPFKHLVGNVAEFVYNQPEGFEELTADEVADRWKTPNDAVVAAIGGSALSPPQLDEKEVYPIASYEAGLGFCDIGLRLAFTAPKPTVAMKLDQLLGRFVYLGPEQP